MHSQSHERGLRVGAVLLIGFGLFCALSALPVLNAPMAFLADLVLWPLDNLQSTDTPLSRVLFAIIGGLITGWGVLVWGLSGAPYRAAPAEIRRLVISGYLAWFVTDSTFSMLAGAPLNVVGNLAFLGLLLWPLRMRREEVNV